MNIGLIGAGNVAWNLAHAFQGSPYKVRQVISRTRSRAAALAEEFGIESGGNVAEELRQDLDLALIATSDHSIGDVARALAPHRGSGTIFAHTSGSIALSTLAPLGPRVGVFYPLQTFTRGHSAEFSAIPIFLEGVDSVLEVLRPPAEFLSRRVEILDSRQRLQLHLGAVFASNFANLMWMVSEDVVGDLEGIDMQVYAPLIRECVDKALRYGPEQAHTGPAKRGDWVTMRKHLEILGAQDAQRAELYKLLSEMIGKRFS